MTETSAPVLVEAQTALALWTDRQEDIVGWGVPDRVIACVERESRGSDLQFVSQLNLISETEERRLARQIAALANGAILRGSQYAYLVFGFLQSRLRASRQDGEAYQIREFGQLSLEETHRALLSILKRNLDRADNIILDVERHQGFGYLTISLECKAPIFSLEPDEVGEGRWILPLWCQTTSREWETNDALAGRKSGKIKRTEPTLLCEAFLLDQATRSQLNAESTGKLVEKLKQQKPATGSELAGFLAGLLLSPTVEERALAAETFAKVGGLKPKARELIARLLTAFLEDDPEVAKQAAESLRQLGDESHIDALMRSLECHRGYTDLFEIVVKSIGELGTPGARKHLLDLWQATAEGTQRQAIDAAIVRLYQRHDIPLHDPQLRGKFETLIGTFQYQQALDLLRDNGRGICLAPEHRRYLITIVEYGMHRAQRAYKMAVDAVDSILDPMLRAEGSMGRALDDTVLRETLSDLRSDVSDLMRPAKAGSMDVSIELIRARELTEKLYLAELGWFKRDYKNVADHICAFLEDVVPSLLSERFRVRFTQDGDRIQDAWLKAHSEIELVLREHGFVQENGKTPERKASRQLLSALVDYFCNMPDTSESEQSGELTGIDDDAAVRDALDDTSESEQSGELTEVPQIVSRLNRVYSLLRNPATHELGETTERRISEIYDASLDRMFSDARQLRKIAIGSSPRKNPFQALNQTILWLLKRADEIPPSGQSLIYSTQNTCLSSE